MRIAWMSDLHLDLVSVPTIRNLANECARMADAALITGDISEAGSFRQDLGEFRLAFGKPVWFVNGNHDFYGASIRKVQTDLAKYPPPGCMYLTASDPIELSPSVGLVGVDGFYDGRNGTIDSRFEMRDFVEIEEVQSAIVANTHARLALLSEKLAKLGDDAVAIARPRLQAALDKYEHVIFATHVPPFPDGAWHKGRPSEPYALPFYTSRAMGDMLFELAYDYPDKKITVLCGHVHSFNHWRILPNLEGYTAWAEYHKPTVNKIIQINTGAGGFDLYPIDAAIPPSA